MIEFGCQMIRGDETGLISITILIQIVVILKFLNWIG